VDSAAHRVADQTTHLVDRARNKTAAGLRRAADDLETSEDMDGVQINKTAVYTSECLAPALPHLHAGT
jgi:hypothetical protein